MLIKKPTALAYADRELGLPHMELQAMGPSPCLCPCSCAHTWGQASAQIRNVLMTKWCFRDGPAPSHSHTGMTPEVPTTHQRRNANTWQSASQVPKHSATGYFRRQSGGKQGKVPGDLAPEGRRARGCLGQIAAISPQLSCPGQMSLVLPLCTCWL